MIGDNSESSSHLYTYNEWAKSLGKLGYFVYVADLIGYNASTMMTGTQEEEKEFRQLSFKKLKDDRKGVMQKRISLAFSQIDGTHSVFQLKQVDFNNVKLISNVHAFRMSSMYFLDCSPRFWIRRNGSIRYGQNKYGEWYKRCGMHAWRFDRVRWN